MSRVEKDSNKSAFRASRFFGLISLDVISLLLVSDGKRFSVIVTHGKWLLISSIKILLDNWLVNFDSRKVLSINVAVAVGYECGVCYNWE